MDQEPESELWSRLSAALRRAPTPPADEAFVSRVMARVEAEERRADLLSWLQPALGLAFAAATALMVFSWTLGAEPVAAGDLLLAGAGNDWLAGRSPVGPDILLGVSLEDR